jgi:hypothetical protein
MMIHTTSSCFTTVALQSLLCSDAGVKVRECSDQSIVKSPACHVKGTTIVFFLLLLLLLC